MWLYLKSGPFCTFLLTRATERKRKFAKGVQLLQLVEVVVVAKSSSSFVVIRQGKKRERESEGLYSAMQSVSQSVGKYRTWTVLLAEKTFGIYFRLFLFLFSFFSDGMGRTVRDKREFKWRLKCDDRWEEEIEWMKSRCWMCIFAVSSRNEIN